MTENLAGTEWTLQPEKGPLAEKYIFGIYKFLELQFVVVITIRDQDWRDKIKDFFLNLFIFEL